MAAGMKHYFKGGAEHKGATHKDANGKLMSGAKHSATSKHLFHLKELSKTAQKKTSSKRVNWKKKK